MSKLSKLCLAMRSKMSMKIYLFQTTERRPLAWQLIADEFKRYDLWKMKSDLKETLKYVAKK